MKYSGVNPCSSLSHKLAEGKLILKNGIRGNIGLFESVIMCVKIVLCFDISERFQPYYGWSFRVCLNGERCNVSIFDRYVVVCRV